jgi:hypothetical protein
MDAKLRELACDFIERWSPHTLLGRFVRWYVMHYICNGG